MALPRGRTRSSRAADVSQRRDYIVAIHRVNAGRAPTVLRVGDATSRPPRGARRTAPLMIVDPGWCGDQSSCVDPRCARERVSATLTRRAPARRTRRAAGARGGDRPAAHSGTKRGSPQKPFVSAESLLPPPDRLVYTDPTNSKGCEMYAFQVRFPQAATALLMIVCRALPLV